MISTDKVLEHSHKSIISAMDNRNLSFIKTKDFLNPFHLMMDIGIDSSIDWTNHYCYNIRCPHRSFLESQNDKVIEFIKCDKNLVKNYNYNTFEFAKLYYLLKYTRTGFLKIANMRQIRELLEIMLSIQEKRTDSLLETRLRYYSSDILILQQNNNDAIIINTPIYNLVLMELTNKFYADTLRFITKNYLSFHMNYVYPMERLHYDKYLLKNINQELLNYLKLRNNNLNITGENEFVSI